MAAASLSGLNAGLLLQQPAGGCSDPAVKSRITTLRTSFSSFQATKPSLATHWSWHVAANCRRRQPGRLKLRQASTKCSAEAGAGGYSEGLERASAAIAREEESPKASNTSSIGPPQKAGATVQVLRAGTLAVVGGTILAAAVTLARGGPAALVEAVTKSGFTAAFSLIFMSEIGDKTFFIAALLAMSHSRYLVLAGASVALALMSGISVIIGRLFRRLPAQLQTTIPVGEYAAIALLLWFGIRNIRAALAIPSKPEGEPADAEDGGELAEAEEFVSKVEADKLDTPWAVFREAFSLVFVAEWGDRSMLATIALGAAQSPVGVALGASLGHVVATGIAVMGGSLLAKYISEKLVSLLSGLLFIGFAAATYWGVF